MSWATVAIIGGGAVLGGIQGAEKRKQEQRLNEAAAEQTRYSPWTSMGAGQLSYSGASGLSGAMGGALSGASMAQSVNGISGANKKPGVQAKNEFAVDPVTGESYNDYYMNMKR